MMNDIFWELVVEGMVVVYIDDILIFTETLEQHWEVTHRVLKLLEENRLYLKLDKCEFEKTQVEYLGVIISHNSVEMDPAKVTGVAEWPVPSTKKELQSFLGFTNFYRRFIWDFSHHACPLFDLTKNNVKWCWTGEEQLAFDTLKGLITSTLILVSPDNTRPFRIEADSSDFVTGAVLSQQTPEDGTGIQSRSCLSPCQRWSGTTRSMIRRCLPSSEPWRSGDTSWRGLSTVLRYRWITKI